MTALPVHLVTKCKRKCHLAFVMEVSLWPEEHFKLVEATLMCQGLRDVTW